jgi:hypothetical protein
MVLLDGQLGMPLAFISAHMMVRLPFRSGALRRGVGSLLRLVALPLVENLQSQRTPGPVGQSPLSGRSDWAERPASMAGRCGTGLLSRGAAAALSRGRKPTEGRRWVLGSRVAATLEADVSPLRGLGDVGATLPWAYAHG